MALNNSLYLFLSYAVLILYGLSLILILIYSLTQLNMLRYFLKYQQSKPKKAPIPTPTHWPSVTIQLPLYNELYVVERLLACITALDYPQDKLQIQVLDDSTDESLALTRSLVQQYQKQGFPIEHLHRTHREGYKAGALKEGLKTARGEFIAIFDADFLPNSNWLRQTVTTFQNPDVGVVQTRWGHLNKMHSVWTSVQAFALDAHFLLEQIGRNQQKHFINFNGTAGIWRKSCILDAGNWQGDTLTEDLDLSYRAQLKQWKFVYREDIETPAELPITLSAIRSQQFRWNKGGAENFQKMIKKVIRSKELSLGTKFNAVVHLLNSTLFLSVFLVSFLSVPLLYIKSAFPVFDSLFNWSSLFILSTLIFFTCYWFVHRTIYGSGVASFLNYSWRFIQFYCLVIGFSVHNSVAVLEGHWGKKSPFVRTPKFNSNDGKKVIVKNKYIPKKISAYTLLELVFSFYFLFGLYSALIMGETSDFWILPFHLILFIGFSSISIFGMKQRL
ncbi:MAG: glycosyltransferase [Flavobacteriaceae bacterium]